MGVGVKSTHPPAWRLLLWPFRLSWFLPFIWLPVIAAVIGGMTLLGIQRQVNTSQGTSRAQIVGTVLSYVNEWQPDKDPLVALDDGLQVKASNVYGVEINGQRYFYRLINGFSWDPLSRGGAKDYEIIETVDQGTPWEVLIYRLR